jgi:hypothetical protein
MALQRRESEAFMGMGEEQARCHVISQDRICQRNILQAVKCYAEALSLDRNHAYHALPRLLSLWFDFTSIRKNESGARLMSQATSQQNTGPSKFRFTQFKC